MNQVEKLQNDRTGRTGRSVVQDLRRRRPSARRILHAPQTGLPYDIIHFTKQEIDQPKQQRKHKREYDATQSPLLIV